MPAKTVEFLPGHRLNRAKLAKCDEGEHSKLAAAITEELVRRAFQGTSFDVKESVELLKEARQWVQRIPAIDKHVGKAKLAEYERTLADLTKAAKDRRGARVTPVAVPQGNPGPGPVH